MNYRGFRRRTDSAGVLAYGCVGAAILFIFAMTFGIFEHPESSPRVAANYATEGNISTP